MSLDLYERESGERLSRMPAVRDPDVGIWDGFARGAGLTTMRGLARTGRAIDLLGSVGPIVKDAFTGGTELQDRYFREHDEVWGSAVDYWTPKPNEVGVAGQITGELLSMLPLIIASPSLAVGATQLGTAEDLVKKGVEPGKAQAVGAVQGAGLGVGIWMPILGQNLWQRVVIGGAGFNTVQGIATRGASGMILQGTPAAKEFEAFDGKALTLDVLLGAAFGSMVHLSPKAREQGGEMWNRIAAWAEGLTPTQKSAIMALRQAQHLNVDSTPGIPASAADVEAHVNRVRTAIEQLERGQPVEVSDLPEPHFDADAPRARDMAQRADELVREAERARKVEGLPEITEPQEPVGTTVTLFRGSKTGEAGNFYSPDRQVAETYAGEGGMVTQEAVTFRNLLTAETWVEAKEKLGLPKSATMPDLIAAAAEKGHDGITFKTTNGAEYVRTDVSETGAPAANRGGTEPPPPRGPRGGEAAGAEAITAKDLDPLALEAERVATERPDMKIRVGTDADGNPVIKSARQYLDDARAHVENARADVTLFEAAARCLLGGG